MRMGEHFDLLDEDGQSLGTTKDRKLVHRDGAFSLERLVHSRGRSCLGPDECGPVALHNVCKASVANTAL